MKKIKIKKFTKKVKIKIFIKKKTMRKILILILLKNKFLSHSQNSSGVVQILILSLINNKILSLIKFKFLSLSQIY